MKKKIILLLVTFLLALPLILLNGCSGNEQKADYIVSMDAKVKTSRDFFAGKITATPTQTTGIKSTSLSSLNSEEITDNIEEVYSNRVLTNEKGDVIGIETNGEPLLDTLVGGIRIGNWLFLKYIDLNNASLKSEGRLRNAQRIEDISTLHINPSDQGVDRINYFVVNTIEGIATDFASLGIFKPATQNSSATLEFDFTAASAQSDGSVVFRFGNIYKLMSIVNNEISYDTIESDNYDPNLWDYSTYGFAATNAKNFYYDISWDEEEKRDVITITDVSLPTHVNETFYLNNPLFTVSSESYFKSLGSCMLQIYRYDENKFSVFLQANDVLIYNTTFKYWSTDYTGVYTVTLNNPNGYASAKTVDSINSSATLLSAGDLSIAWPGFLTVDLDVRVPIAGEESYDNEILPIKLYKQANGSLLVNEIFYDQIFSEDEPNTAVFYWVDENLIEERLGNMSVCFKLVVDIDGNYYLKVGVNSVIIPQEGVWFGRRDYISQWNNQTVFYKMLKIESDNNGGWIFIPHNSLGLIEQIG